MSRITSTTDLGNGLVKTTENRDHRVVIVIGDDGAVNVTLERVTVTRINGSQIGGATAAPSVAFGPAQAAAVAGFAQAYAAIRDAGDAADQAADDARANGGQS